MPTYEYACKACGEHLEIVQSFTDDPLTVCPACRGQLRKVFQPVGIAFKGSGFYKNDSRSKSSSSSSSSGESSSSKSESTKSESTKSESTKSESSSTSTSSPTKGDSSSSSSSSSTPAAAS